MLLASPQRNQVEITYRERPFSGRVFTPFIIILCSSALYFVSVRVSFFRTFVSLFCSFDVLTTNYRYYVLYIIYRSRSFGFYSRVPRATVTRGINKTAKNYCSLFYALAIERDLYRGALLITAARIRHVPRTLQWHRLDANASAANCSADRYGVVVC